MPSFSTRVAWSAFTARKMTNLAQAGVNYLDALRSLCLADKDYRAVSAS